MTAIQKMKQLRSIANRLAEKINELGITHLVYPFDIFQFPLVPKNVFLCPDIVVLDARRAHQPMCDPLRPPVGFFVCHIRARFRFDCLPIHAAPEQVNAERSSIGASGDFPVNQLIADKSGYD